MPKDFVKKEDLSELSEVKKDLDTISKVVLRLLPTKELMNFENDH